MFAALAALVCSVMAAQSAGRDTAAAGSFRTDCSEQPAQINAGRFGQHASQFGSDPNFALKPPTGPSNKELLVKMLLSIIVVTVLGAGAIYASRKFGTRFAGLSGKTIEVIETVHIGPRKSLHLLKVGASSFLIGSSSESVVMLAEVTEALAQESQEQSNSG